MKKINFKYQKRVEFYDVDSMSIMWHGNYVKFLESARCAFLTHIGYDYDDMKKDGYALPIIKMDFKYIKPAFFKDVLTINVFVMEYETTLKLGYEIYSKDELINKATTTQACIEIATLKTLFSLPDQLVSKIRIFDVS